MDISVPTLTIVVAFLGVLTVTLLAHTISLRKRLKSIFVSEGETSLDKAFEAHLKRTGRLEQEVKRHLDELAAIRKEFQKSYQKVSITRFDSLGEANGNQSFTLVALDGTHNGFILTNLQMRDTARLYIKPIESGKARLKLSVEEETALAQIMK